MELKRYKLGEIAEILISSIDKKSKEGESPVRLCNFVDVYHNWAITADMVSNFMESTTSEKNIERFSLKKGYVAFTKDSETRDDIGVPTYIAEDLDNTVLGYHCALVKPDENIISGKYLNAFLHSDYIKRYFELNATGSGMRYTLSVDTLYNIPILAPSLDIQKRIGDLFSNIDRKICINRSLNHYLEAMAKQLYDYWFVQFDFSDENGKPYKSSGGKMVWNEKLKKEIPLGWECCLLSDYLSVYSEKVIPGEVRKDDRYAPIEVLPRNKMCFSECAPIENALSGLCRFKYKHILLSNRRVYFHKVCIAPFDGLTRDTVIILNPIHKYLLGYSYQLVNDDKFIEYATRHSYGTEQPVLSWEAAKQYKVIKPSNNWDKRYSFILETIIDEVVANEHEISELTKQRDVLLPLLMTGQISVKQLNNDLSHD